MGFERFYEGYNPLFFVMKLSLLIPCYNEEKTVKSCVLSCLSQTRPFDQIVVVNDGSIDKTGEILKSFGRQIKVVNTQANTGNKSRAQEYGLGFITGDVVVMTDADTLLSPNFSEAIETEFKHNQADVVVGYVQSLRHNWLTALREIDYIMGQDIYKKAQSHLNSILVVSGCAAAFKTSLFKKLITFDHDTLTEDLDFTYKAHAHNLAIRHSNKAVVYTQDPNTLHSYINQMRRWIGGGIQNAIKHRRTILTHPKLMFEIVIMYGDSLLFSAVLLSLFFVDVVIVLQFLAGYIALVTVVGIYSFWQRGRSDLLIFIPLFLLLNLLNLYILFEQLIKVMLFRNTNLVWFKPERRAIV